MFYPLIFKEKAQYCPGEVCDIKNKQDIQKTSKLQLLILLAFIAFTVLMVKFFNDNFSEKPYNLFGENNTEQSK
jgi:hypothetical protein